MSYTPCCVKGFQWDGTPTGREDKLAGNDVYIAGSGTTDAAVLLIHDLFGWTFPNIRLVADHIASETGVTVYAPDFFGGLVLPFDKIKENRFAELDLPTIMAKNSRQVREPEIFAAARALREKHAKVGAVGYCFGGWAVLRLAAKEHQPPLVDAIVCAHPSLVTKEDILGVGPAVPVQVLAPEHDPAYSPELKSLTFDTFQKAGIHFDYQHFPGVEHACFIRGDENKSGERDAMIRAKSAAVAWFAQWLK